MHLSLILSWWWQDEFLFR